MYFSFTLAKLYLSDLFDLNVRVLTLETHKRSIVSKVHTTEPKEIYVYMSPNFCFPLEKWHGLWESSSDSRELS